METKKLNLKDYQTREDIIFKDFTTFQNRIEMLGVDVTDENMTREIIKIFYKINTHTQRNLTQTQIDTLLDKINNVLAQPETEFQNVIIKDGVTYGFIPDFSKITSGELIDIEMLLSEGEHGKLTSILYRPIVGKILKDGSYTIEDYKGYNNEFENISLAIVEGYSRLFTKSFQTLKDYTHSSTETEKKVM